MPQYLVQKTISSVNRQDLLMAFPCFASLTEEQSQALSSLWAEVTYEAQEKIVIEHDLVDSIYIIVNGEAEVTYEIVNKKKTVNVPVAVLNTGEGIGLNDTGFYSTTGKRTATVTAMTDMVLLRLSLKDLYGFLKRNDLELSMYAASQQMMRMNFIKQSLPFSKLSHDRLKWLAERVVDMDVAAGTIIFSQGEQGDCCYLIRSGRVEIINKDEESGERQLAVLKPPVLFGEATLITHTPRNATARALENCELLSLRHEYLSELLESEDNVANMFMTLMVDRSLPLKNPNVTVHQRTTADGQKLSILKNPENGNYFKLSEEGTFIWKQLDGKHTMQDITLALAEDFKVFAPDVVAALISKLTKSGFIENIDIEEKDEAKLKGFFGLLRKVLAFKYAFGDADPWITKLYQKYMHYFFSKTGQIILAIFAVWGLVSFALNTSDVLLFFSVEHASFLLLLGLIPLSLIAVVLHELGHAFAVKAFGREVHYIGIGWYWFGPVAFTDTSDMWLATRKPRMLVNIAGVYVDFLVAGSASFLMFAIPNPYIQGMLWIFALYTYIGGFRMLSPLQELDGYYILSDWVEKTKLRQAAVIWLVKTFPKCLRKPALFKRYKAEVSYWVACIFFLMLVTILTLLVQAFVLQAVGIASPNPYIALVLPFVVVLLSSLSIIGDIRKAEE
ncbi:MAG: PqqD family peptide modification chaperone [Gammaproteobacteria bacterium]